MSRTRQLVPPAKASPPFYLGVDLGGTNIKMGLVDEEGQSVGYAAIPTDRPKGPDDGCRRMGQAMRDLIAQAGLRPGDVAGVGLGSPGPLDLAKGLMLAPVNMPGWHNFPLVRRLTEESGFTATLTNDANAAAYGEFWVGSGRDLHSMVMITLGTGVGSGIVLGDLLVEGENSCGAECGHIIIDYADDARMCGCGQRGHVEAYCSGSAVVERTREELERGRPSDIGRRVQGGEELTPLLISEEAAAGDALALEIVLETAKLLGICLVSVIHVLDPSGIVLGGAMNFGGRDSELGRTFLGRIRQEIRQRAFPVPAANVSLEYALLGSDAGYIGAAGLARKVHQRVKFANASQ